MIVKLLPTGKHLRDALNCIEIFESALVWYPPLMMIILSDISSFVIWYDISSRSTERPRDKNMRFFTLFILHRVPSLLEHVCHSTNVNHSCYNQHYCYWNSHFNGKTIPSILLRTLSYSQWGLLNVGGQKYIFIRKAFLVIQKLCNGWGQFR